MSTVDVPGAMSPAHKNLIRAWWKKATVGNFKADSMTDSSSDGYGDKRVFGAPLSESLKYAHSSISYLDAKTGKPCYGVIPTVIAKCGSYLKEEGLMVEGIFRLSGSAKRISKLQAVFDETSDFGASFNWGVDYTVHDAANVMRRFLNHLPEPVITLEYYRPFKDALHDEYPSVEAKIDAFQNLIECLPIFNQYLLMYIMDMLGLFAMTSDVTRMDISSLAAVFAPGVLSHPDDEMNPAGYRESQRVLEFLIEHQHEFSAPRSCIPPNQSLVPRDSVILPNPPSSPRRKLSTTTTSPFEGAGPDYYPSFSSTSIPSSTLKRSNTLSSAKGRLIMNFAAASSSTSVLPAEKPPSGLKRSKTAPSKRQKAREQQENTKPSSEKKYLGRWKSIRRVTEKDQAIASH
ncbi:hypothetical protein VTP01DRAFT_7687 [Rhizomucor pusillus]|uniref:uncharacterized protein n=1 Tax=Rhizomucor pusillus TaxID=4840 RepID=UPI0037422D15